MSVVQYELLCELVCNASISDRSLEVLKSVYSKEINSIRRSDAIKSLKDFIAILKKRASISAGNVSILREIAEALNIAVPYSEISHERVSPDILLAEPATSYNTPRQINGYNLPSVSTTAKQRVYELIAREIGQKWKELGRQLHIREGQLDTLEDRYRDISERTYKILYHFEQTCDRRQWKTNLLNALVDARRKDLKRNAETIFDTHE